MWSGVDDLYLSVIRNQVAATPEVTYLDLFTGDVIPRLPVVSGTVTDDATSNVRRTLSIVLPPLESVYDLFEAPAGLIVVSKTTRTGGHTKTTIPLGTFVVDADQIGYGAGDTLTLTCPDRWRVVQQNRFGVAGRASIPSNPVWAEIKRLVEGAWPNGAYPFPGWSTLDKSATTAVGSLYWDDGNRETAILGLAADNNLDVYFDRDGMAVLEPLPTLTPSVPPVWTVDAGESGVMVGADRSRDRSRTFNAVIASTSAQDITLTPQVAQNTTPGDPFAVTGPYGFVPDYYSSPNIRTTAQAVAAATARLSKTLGLSKQLSMSSVSNDALDSNDPILVVLPLSDAGDCPSELHILDSVVTPLGPDSQTMTTRVTIPAAAHGGTDG